MAHKEPLPKVEPAKSVTQGLFDSVEAVHDMATISINQNFDEVSQRPTSASPWARL